MSLQVNPAKLEDIPRLCELLAILFTQEAEFSAQPEAQARGLTAIITTPEIGAILALRQEGKITGMVNLLFTVSTYLGAKVALLEDMIIDPVHRSNGAGTFLIQAAIQHAKESGCHRITLLTDTVNFPARAFYRKIGFKESAMVPYKILI